MVQVENEVVDILKHKQNVAINSVMNTACFSVDKLSFFIFKLGAIWVKGAPRRRTNFFSGN